MVCFIGTQAIRGQGLTLTGDVVNRIPLKFQPAHIREVIFDLAGNRGGKKFKAVQIGGTQGDYSESCWIRP